MCVPQQAYLGLIPALRLTEVPETAVPEVGPALGTIAYGPGTCRGTDGGRDGGSQHHRLGRSMAPSHPHWGSSCPLSCSTHRQAAGAPHSPVTGEQVWPLPPSSSLLDVSPARAWGSHWVSWGQGMLPAPGGHKPFLLWTESSHFQPTGADGSPGVHASLSLPWHRSPPHALTASPGTAQGPQPTLGCPSPTSTSLAQSSSSVGTWGERELLWA